MVLTNILAENINLPFGDSLPLADQDFLRKYCTMVIYGNLDALPDAEKLQAYEKLISCLDKMSPKEIVEFNKFTINWEMAHLSKRINEDLKKDGVSFGMGLLPEDKAFLDKYCSYISEFGDVNNFPLTDGEKLAQYEKLKAVLDKMSAQDISAFNKFCDASIDKALDNQDYKPTM